MNYRIVLLAAFLIQGVGYGQTQKFGFEDALQNQPTDEAISHATLFKEPLIPVSGANDATENQDLAQALLSYAHQADRTNIQVLTTFLTNHPNSRWTGSLLLDLGYVHRQSGYFSRAMNDWQKSWDLLKSSDDHRLKLLADRAIGELLEMHARLGHFEIIESTLQDISTRKIEGSATEKVAAAKQGLWTMKNRPGVAFKCGPFALSRILASIDPKKAFDPIIINAQSTIQGTSLAQVAGWADSLSMNMQMAKRESGAQILVPCVINWKAGHYAAIVKQNGDQYLVQDPTFGDNFWISSDAINSEASGYFLVRSGALPDGWRSVDSTEGSTIWGKGYTSNTNPENTKNCDEQTGGSGGGCSSCMDSASGMASTPGMATYTFHSMNISLHITDTPVSVRMPWGQNFSFKLTYNQRDAYQPNVFSYSNFGPKWTCDWISYIDNPSNGQAFLYMPGGGRETYAYSAPSGMGSILRPASYRIAGGLWSWMSSLIWGQVTEGPKTVSPPHIQSRGNLEYHFSSANSLLYVIRYMPDGSQWYYEFNDGSRFFLTRMVDPQGRTTTLTYDQANGNRLQTVSNSFGAYTFTYSSSDPSKIVQVTDPHGRTATFDYFPDGHLKKITDAVGMTSEFTYGDSDFIASLKTIYGTTQFAYGDDGNTRWLEATDPNQDTERVEYNQNTNIPFSETEVPQMSLANNYLDNRNSFYWDKKAYKEYRGDYSKAHIYHWLHDINGSLTSGILESEKKPLENRVWYYYQGQTNPKFADANMVGSFPSQIGRVVQDSSGNLVTQLYQYSYNDLGKTLTKTDPSGRQTTYVYDSNKIDLLEVRQTTGTNNELLTSYTYNANHQPLTVTDASRQTSVLAYNNFGQVSSVTNPKNETTTWNYDSAGFLTSVTGPAGNAIYTLTYDLDSQGHKINRVKTVTDADNYALTFSYDNLDRLVETDFPDGTNEKYLFTGLDVEWVKDRNNHWSRMFHDPLRRVVAYQDPLNRITQYYWCRCGSLAKIIDPNGNTTYWDLDLQGRQTAKHFADGSQISYTYDSRISRLTSMQDALGQVTSYKYNLDDTVQQINYNNTVHLTPSVAFNYDANYPRVSSIVDGMGTNSYSYYPITSPATLGAGRLASVSASWHNEVCSYTYDELGRATNVAGVARSFDSLGRVISESNALGTFTPSYVNSTARLSSVAYPNGQQVNFDYFDNLGNKQLKQIKVLMGANMLSQFDYTHDSVGNIATWNKQWNGGVSENDSMIYNSADQLISDISTRGSVSMSRYYTYDKSGNRLSEQINNNVTSASFNGLNQMTNLVAGGPTYFSGTVNKPSTVTVNGASASVSTNNVFTAWVNLSSGTNTVSVVAQDYGGNARTNNYQVINGSGTPKSLSYDANGNMVSDGGRTFEWDAVNRLTAIQYADGSRSEFSYDYLNRRSLILEKNSSNIVVSTNKFVWSGNAICKETDGSNIVIKEYFNQGFRSGSTNFYYQRDHLGSIREVADSSGFVQAAYEYDPYGRMTPRLPVQNGLKAWYRADAGVVANSANQVTQWTDQSGNGNHATVLNGDVNYSPTWADKAMGGRPVLRFSDTHPNQLQLAPIVQNDFTVIAVFQSTHGATTNSPGWYLGESLVDAEVGGNVNDWGMSLKGDGKVTAGTGNLAMGRDDVVNSASGYNNGQAHVAYFQRTQSTGEDRLFMDGTDQGSVIGSTNPLNSPPRFTIGWLQTNPGGWWYRGDIAEIIIYNRVLNAAERQTVDAYLKQKYSMPGANATLVSDFGFTGHYYHQASGLNLSLYRAYSSDMGRWLSRDPIVENGGINIYSYAENNPINNTDPLGLVINDSSWWGGGLKFTVEKCEVFLFFGHNDKKHPVQIKTPNPCSAAGAVTCWPGSVNNNIGNRLPGAQTHDDLTLFGSSSSDVTKTLVDEKNQEANELGYDIDGDAQVAALRKAAEQAAQNMLKRNGGCCDKVKITEYRNGIGPAQNPVKTIQ